MPQECSNSELEEGGGVGKSNFGMVWVTNMLCSRGKADCVQGV